MCSITEDAYDKFFQSFNEKKVELETRLALLSEAEDNYYITAKYLLDIANRAYDLFVRSEVEERRQLLKLVLQNLRLEGKLVRYDALKPFDTILNYNDNQLGLPEHRIFISIDFGPIIQAFQDLRYIGEMRQR